VPLIPKPRPACLFAATEAAAAVYGGIAAVSAATGTARGPAVSAVRATSLAEEQLNLFEESVRGRLIFQEQMILALKSDEVGTRNASSQLAASLEWNHEVRPAHA
jgi:hypothetical protein